MFLFKTKTRIFRAKYSLNLHLFAKERKINIKYYTVIYIYICICNFNRCNKWSFSAFFYSSLFHKFYIFNL